MGIETLAIAGFTGLQAMQTMKQGNAAAKAAVQQGQYTIQNQADNTVRAAGKLQTSFLNSGISIDGGPMDVITQALTKGTTDIQRTADNVNTTAKNDISAARTKALEGIAKNAASAGTGSFGVDSLTYGTDSWNGFGQELGSIGGGPMGPYQSPISTSSSWWG